MTQISDKMNKLRIPTLVAIVTWNLTLKKVGREGGGEKKYEKKRATWSGLGQVMILKQDLSDDTQSRLSRKSIFLPSGCYWADSMDIGYL